MYDKVTVRLWSTVVYCGPIKSKSPYSLSYLYSELHHVRKPDQKNYTYFSKYKPCVEEGKMLLRTVSEHSWGLELFVCFGDILNKQELLDNNLYG